MNDRMTALGRSCQIGSCPGRGTAVAGRVGYATAPADNAGAVRLTVRMGRNLVITGWPVPSAVTSPPTQFPAHDPHQAPALIIVDFTYPQAFRH